MRKIAPLGTWLVLAAAGLTILWYAARSPQTPQIKPVDDSPPPAQATVVDIVDGDEIILDSGHHVRFIGLRTPSVAAEIQCFGPETVAANEQVVGKHIYLETEPLLERSDDGTWTRYVWLIQGQRDADPTTDDPPDIFINERILEGGFGFPVLSPDMIYADRLAAAARFARATSKGLWSQCEIRSTNKGYPITAARDECTIKGIVADSGTHEYFPSSCSEYSAVIVHPANGDQYFCSEDEAQLAGFSKAASCS